MLKMHVKIKYAFVSEIGNVIDPSLMLMYHCLMSSLIFHISVDVVISTNSGISIDQTTFGKKKSFFYIGNDSSSFPTLGYRS